jgi:predicted nucleic acid-binding protein
VNVYPDTSFLVSLYTPDANSIQAAHKMRTPHTVFLTSDLAELELMNALQQRLFRKELKATEVQLAQKAFQEDIEEGVFQRKPMGTGAVYARALRLSRKWTATLGTRTLDILHVAIALELGADVLFTFDRQQSKLAHAEGLKVL